MEARERHTCATACPGGAQMAQRISRSLTQRMFESVLGDIEQTIVGWRSGANPERFTLEILEDRVGALRHLAEDGPVCKALEHAETAFVEAVLAVPPTINFAEARRAMEREEQDSFAPESGSGTGFANSYTNSKRSTNSKPKSEDQEENNPKP